jgi:hypothetical protein
MGKQYSGSAIVSSIVDSSERIFRSQYIPIVSEFRIGAEPFDFNLEERIERAATLRKVDEYVEG